MLKISIVDTQSERRLTIEGKLVQPWAEELLKTWLSAKERLQGRTLIVDLGSTTVIGGEGEAALLELMRDGAEFACTGVLTKYVLGKLARKCRTRPRCAKQEKQMGSD